MVTISPFAKMVGFLALTPVNIHLMFYLILALNVNIVLLYSLWSQLVFKLLIE